MVEVEKTRIFEVEVEKEYLKLKLYLDINFTSIHDGVQVHEPFIFLFLADPVLGWLQAIA